MNTAIPPPNNSTSTDASPPADNTNPTQPQASSAFTACQQYVSLLNNRESDIDRKLASSAASALSSSTLKKCLTRIDKDISPSISSSIHTANSILGISAPPSPEVFSQLNTLTSLISKKLSESISSSVSPSQEELIFLSLALSATADAQKELALSLIKACNKQNLTSSSATNNNSKSDNENNQKQASLGILGKELGAMIGGIAGNATENGIQKVLGALFNTFNETNNNFSNRAADSPRIEELDEDDENLYGDVREDAINIIQTQMVDEDDEHLYADAQELSSGENTQTFIPLSLNRSPSNFVSQEVREKYSKWTADPVSFSKSVLAIAKSSKAPFSSVYLSGAPQVSSGIGGFGGSGATAANERLPAPSELFQLRWLRTSSNVKVFKDTPAPSDVLGDKYICAVLEKASRCAEKNFADEDYRSLSEQEQIRRFPNLTKVVSMFR